MGGCDAAPEQLAEGAPRRHLQPRRRDRLAGDAGDAGDEQRHVGIVQLLGEGRALPRLFVAEGLAARADEPVQILQGPHPSHLNAVGRRPGHIAGEIKKHQGAGRGRLEAGLGEASGQARRAVMIIDAPHELLTPRAEPGHLLGHRPAHGLRRQIPGRDVVEAASQQDEPIASFDGDPSRGSRIGAHLGVETGQHKVKVHSPRLTRTSAASETVESQGVRHVYSAVVGLMIVRTWEMALAGKPAFCACSRSRSSLGAR